MRTLLLLTALSLTVTSCTLVTDDLHPPSIQRPLISRNTETTFPGQIDFELGITGGIGWEMPAAVRWGAGPNVETFLEFDAWRHRSTGDGIGDLSVGVRHRFAEDKEAGKSYAYQLRTKLPTADAAKGLGSGSTDFDLAAIMDWTTGGRQVTTYYALGLLGTTGAQGGDIQHTLATASTIELDGPWDGVWEIAGIYAPNAGVSEIAVTLAGTYQVAPLAVFDVGVRVGLGGSARDPLFFIGIGRALGRLISSASL
jgi:hypothetical protein